MTVQRAPPQLSRNMPGAGSYFPFIDGLRALAIIGVVIYHAMPQAMPGGFSGVDVFFVVSGFLITRLILEERRAGAFSFKQFYIRRARRLLPAAVFCFCCVAAISAFVLLPDAYWYLGRSLLASALMYANVFFYNTGGYFSAPAIEKPLLHTWSLAVEDQFYLTWPLILMFLTRIGPSGALRVVLALAVVSLAYCEFTLARNSEAAFFLLPSRAWELLVGATIALRAPRRPLVSEWANAVTVAGVAAILASFWLLRGDGHFPGLGAVPACVGTAAIITANLEQPTLVARFLATRPLVFGGKISYSFYLWHWPLISLLSYRLERPLYAHEAAAVVGLAFVISVASWRFVERPFRVPRERGLSAHAGRPDARFALQSVAAVLAIVAIAVALKVGRGFPQRYDAQVQTAMKQMVSGNPIRGACDNYENIFRNDDVCSIGRKRRPGQSYEVALFGDSMADHWTPMVAKYATEQNLTFRQVTNGGCGLFFGIAIPARPAAKANECSHYQQEAKKFIGANPGLKVAVLSGYWEKWLSRIEFPEHAQDFAPPNVQRTPKFDAVLKQTLDVFTSKGIRVVLIGQIPVYGMLPVRCVVSRIEHKEDAASCGLTRQAAAAQMHLSNAALERAASENPMVTVSLPAHYMCQEKMCSPVMGGTLLYKNASHVNRYGAVALRRFVEFPNPGR
ncbi:MAG TPA: acyltransferase family protein [Hyphomicrobium sp.]|nr:acyltransferase family protein [Hyphomicrobium sp.]